ncbi:hypothetical protein Bca4012_077769 [Brassica carinata]
MVLIYVKSDEWVSSCSEEWSFVVDKARRGRMVLLETTTPLEKLKRIVCGDYGVDHNVLNTEFNYSMVNQRGNPPIIITNDRQAYNFVAYAKRDSSTILCVTFSGLGVNKKERVNIYLNKEPCDSINVEDEEVPEITRADFVKPSKESCDTRKDHVAADGSDDAGLRSGNNGDSEKEGRAWRGDFVKKDQIFRMHIFTDGLYTTAAWRTTYAESINPIAVPECEWNVRAEVKLAKVLPPETRKSAGRPIKRRYESVKDKIKSSQGSRKNKKHKRSRCGTKGHKRGTCDLPI